MHKDIYEISSNTCMIISKDLDNCTLIEKEKEIEIPMNIQKYINYNCEYYGSSFEGRHKSSQSILGMKYKLPIIIEESNELVFFPTKSYDNEKCCWISLKSILFYKKNYNNTKIKFTCGKTISINISIESFENQILRANQLLTILKNRKLR